VRGQREQQAHRAGHPHVERQDRVRRTAGEHRARALLLEQTAGQAHGRTKPVQPKARHRERPARDTQRSEQVFEERRAEPHERLHQALPRPAIDAQAVGRVLHRAA
jgi:hypothetical protein